MQNILAKVPDSAQPEVKAEVRAAYQAPNVEVVELVAARVLEKYGEVYPSAMKSFRENWDACVAYLRCPVVHHRRIRTTNVQEMERPPLSTISQPRGSTLLSSRHRFSNGYRT